MRMADVVRQLQQLLPAKTDRFHDVVAISSIVATGSIATITTAGSHDLASGHLAALTGVETRTPIATASKDGLVTTFTTSADHDLTEGNPDTIAAPLAGFTDPAWNIGHELIRVDNLRTFSVRNALAAPVLNGGELLLEPNRIDGLNGVFEITRLDSQRFTISGDFIPGTYTPFNGKVVSNPRIFPAVTVEKAKELYDGNPFRFWAFAIPGQAVVSKDRSTESDAVSARFDGDTLRLRLLDEFSIYVFAPTQDELGGEVSMDICRHDLLGPIVSALFGSKLDSGLACGQSEIRIAFTGHGIADYDGAVLIHEFAFQAPADLTDEDGARTAGDRAFREIDYTQLGQHTPLTASINLDKEPLP